jgi:phytoene dehydrogenase-like protein
LAENKRLIIIGAGIAGLSAGCYARMNGYDVDIYEMHDKAGGMCTSWARKGYTFDYCIHNLAGTTSSGELFTVWGELGALEDTKIINHSEFVCIESGDDAALHWYTDLDKLDEHIKQIAPEDSPLISGLIKTAKKLSKVDLNAMSLGGFRRILKALPYVPTINRLSKTFLGEYVKQIKNPFLKRTLFHIMYDMPGDPVPMTALVLFMAGMSKGDFGWPEGGSLAFARRIENRLNSLGCSINYKKQVDKIIVENNRAVGIRLSDDTEIRGDYIVSAADGYSTIYQMLEGKYLTEPIVKYYASAGDTSPFGLVVYLGLSREFPDTPHALTILYDEKIDLGGIEQDSLHVVTYGPESGLAPEGKSVMKIEVQASYSYWKSRRDANLKAYREEKNRIAEKIIDRLSPRFHGLRDCIEVMDICTPPTSERYTGNRFGWQAGPPQENASEAQRKGLSITLPGLDGFYHVGQWSNATLGVSSVAISGRNLVKNLCKQDGKRFISNA